jgi:hypothetical protein
MEEGGKISFFGEREGYLLRTNIDLRFNVTFGKETFNY